MGSYSNYLENKWLNHILNEGGAPFGVPAVVALALSTADPTEDGSGLAEPVGGGYVRTTCKTKFTVAADSRIISNNLDIVAAQASGNQGTISHFALFDSATTGAGNMLGYGQFAVAKSIGAGQTLKVLAGEIDISIPASNGMTTYISNEMLDHTFLNGDAGYTQPTLSLALGANTPFADAGSWTPEVADANNYARMAINFTVTASAATNNGAVTSGVATGTWGTVSEWALGDGSGHNLGNMILYGTWNSAQAIIADDQFNVPDGDLDINLD